MKFLKKYGFFVIVPMLLVTIFLACKKEVVTVKMHYNYYGLIPGKYIIYNVKEMYHDDTSNIHDTTIYQLKTYIGQDYIDNQGRIAKEFKRFKRNTSSDPWVLADVWTSIIDDYKAELVEENQRIVKMVFATTNDKVWNPNMFNIGEPLKYNYTNLHNPLTFNSITFDSTITVDQGSFISMIDLEREYEVYATNVGLINKVYKDLTIANSDSTNVKKGSEIYYNFVSHGF
jgi:hypothetical protein